MRRGYSRSNRGLSIVSIAANRELGTRNPEPGTANHSEMIFRRYGKSIVGVTPNFDARALTEISFTRTGDEAVTAEEFEERYRRSDGRELTARSEGEIQGEAEVEVLRDLQLQLEALDREAGDRAVLLVENQPGHDQAKTRCAQTTKVVGVSNRLHFEFSIDPPLKIGIYVERGHEP